jgi:dTDP-4-amino-4,6-dideoxygalactose transaminase
MQVPLLDLKAQYAAIKHEIEPAVSEVLASQYFILGPKVKELEEKISAYCNTEFAVGVSSGSDALLICLMVSDIGPGDEVITTPYTFFATAGAIHRMGAKAVFVDIDPKTFNINPDQIQEKITEKTRAIIPVHLFGQMADMDPIMDIAKKHNLLVIEDGAQAIGSEYKGRKAGSIGDFGCFSFFPSKNLGGFGDGGIVTATSRELYEKLVWFRGHGANPKYYHKFIGGNFRLDTLQAAVLLIKLGYLDNWSAKRRENAQYYNKAFKGKNITTPEIADFATTIYNQYVILAKDRDGLIDHLKKNKIGCEIYYPVPLHLQECFKDLAHKKGDFPCSEYAADHSLALPIYPELTQEQMRFVADKVIEFTDNS